MRNDDAVAIDLEDLRAFLAVAELGGFTRAAERLRSSKARVSTRVGALEAELGTRLFTRTTRAVHLTPDGETLVVRARRVLREVDDLASLVQGAGGARGLVRVDAPVMFARERLIPQLPELLAAHPQLELVLHTSDRRVDVVRDGYDCVLRIGTLGDSGLVARRLGTLPMVNVASPAYLLRHGTPRTLEALASHVVVHYGGGAPCFDYVEGGRNVEHPMRATLTVDGVDAYYAAAIAGLGIIQVPRLGARAALAEGRLVELLPEHVPPSLPVSIVHAQGRSPPRRVRVVMAWIAQCVTPHVDPV
jgi:DNA-binding transcriptional LysR family regulator